MSDSFYIDNHCNKRVTFDCLLADLNSTTSFNPVCLTDDYYIIFRTIIISMIIDQPLCLSEKELTEEEFRSLEGAGLHDRTKDVTLRRIFSVDDLLERIRNTKRWKVILFTSGTTGIPKKVAHSFKSLTRTVKASVKHDSDIWGFAYNPKHMAGLQVFFQALLNKNTIVRLFGLSRELIVSSIINEKVTHLSATPTFYRLLLPMEETIATVKRITSGGEKLDPATVRKLKAVFINAVILNVYASTEAGTILVSENEIFSVKDENRDMVKIVNRELYIHSDLLGESDSFIMEGDWYPTKDLVKVISESPLKFIFISRKNEMINVGGYKVNPQEIENVLLSLEGIKDAYIYHRKNSVIGNIICADIMSLDSSVTVQTILGKLRSFLPEYKIPRIINIVDSIKYSNTGKKIRQ